MREPALPGPVVRALTELTERALAVGLDDAVRNVLDELAAVGWIVAPHDGGWTTVEAPDPESADLVVEAMGDAVASATRAVAAHATETAHVDELRELARLDDLTGVLNRRAFFERLDEALARNRRTDAPVTLVLCDLDGFKAINDAYGHPAGDEALRAFAALLATNLRASDSVGRVGGDEFGLILIGAEPGDEDGILSRLVDTHQGGEPTVPAVRASFGSARFPADGATRDALVEAADRRLYEDKRRAQA